MHSPLDYTQSAKEALLASGPQQAQACFAGFCNELRGRSAYLLEELKRPSAPPPHILQEFLLTRTLYYVTQTFDRPETFRAFVDSVSAPGQSGYTDQETKRSYRASVLDASAQAGQDFRTAAGERHRTRREVLHLMAGCGAAAVTLNGLMIWRLSDSTGSDQTVRERAPGAFLTSATAACAVGGLISSLPQITDRLEALPFYRDALGLDRKSMEATLEFIAATALSAGQEASRPR